ncbi:unnamed protein product [Fraxinus pennsylvanica]|uniref:Peptidase C1A papain C-terminal domain-containing protein n=1 Tax=Fraxinus pennsylvanica TaxID=56036 RepID=A0AAD2E981_9LAMI|nr:unnamed protein product [Fraxinus pennsylvanica]
MFEKVKALPASLDWRARGAVTPVQDQGQCVAAIEGLVKIKTGNSVSLSEQQIIDCISTSDACNGGWMEQVFEFVKKNRGLASDKNYPYRAKKKWNCSGIKSSSQLAITFYKNGILTGKCGTNLNHIALVVGYGTSIDGTKHWILKNSWGPDWGEKGYITDIRVQRGIKVREGMCGIAKHASYPTK